MIDLNRRHGFRKWGLCFGILGIVGLIASGMWLSSAVQNARIAAQRTSDKGHLKQLAVAAHNYYDNYGQFPPPFIADPNGRPMHSWRVLLLPYMGSEERELYGNYRFSEPWNSPHNQKLGANMPFVYAFKGVESSGNTMTNILAVTGPETMWPEKGGITFQDVKDGMDDSLMFVENDGAGIHWMEPRDLLFEEMNFTLNSPAGVSSKHLEPQVSTIQGYVKRLNKELAPATLRALFTINGQERLGDDGHGNWILLTD